MGLIILLAIIGLVGAAGLKMGALLQRRAAEQELLDIGAAFADALQSYAGATPAGQAQQPPALNDLLKDPRFPGTRRHLRKLYVDPITGRAEWGLIYRAGGSGVVGVYSLSQARPLKVGNFELRFTQFAGKDSLSEWKFMAAEGALPPTVAPPPQSAGTLRPAPLPGPLRESEAPAGHADAAEQEARGDAEESAAESDKAPAAQRRTDE
ncbi:type II secretion system protein [Janthinobacterium sp.]|uniref:type II secretion system protein n=1 Tax=Janthinobacterium sp. TaxID=1871054 RepID=UPI003977C813